MLKNIIKIFRSTLGMMGIIIGMAVIAIPGYYFMDKDLIIGNLGHTFYITEMLLTVTIAILFGLFIGAILYKIQYFNVKQTGVGMLGGIFGALVSGCPACSITLASYLGLAGFISILPYYGLELKFLSIAFLLYANYSTISTLELCKIKK